MSNYQIRILVELETTGNFYMVSEFEKKILLDFVPFIGMWLEFDKTMVQIESVTYIRREQSFFIRTKKVFGDFEVMREALLESGFSEKQNI